MRARKRRPDDSSNLFHLEGGGGRGGGGEWGMVLPSDGLMGMCSRMASHFHGWVDYNGVAFSKENSGK